MDRGAALIRFGLRTGRAARRGAALSPAGAERSRAVRGLISNLLSSLRAEAEAEAE